MTVSTSARGAAVVGRVDLLALAGAGDRHVEVAGDRQHLRLPALEVQHHDRVGALAAGRLGTVEPGVALLGDVGAGVGAHDEVVGAARRRRQRRRHVDPLDAVEDAAGVQEAAHQPHDDEHGHDEQHPPPAQPPVPGPVGPGAAGRRLGGRDVARPSGLELPGCAGRRAAAARRRPGPGGRRGRARPACCAGRGRGGGDEHPPGITGRRPFGLMEAVGHWCSLGPRCARSSRPPG